MSNLDGLCGQSGSLTTSLAPSTWAKPASTKTKAHAHLDGAAKLLRNFVHDVKTLYLFIANYNAIIVIWSTIGMICSQRFDVDSSRIWSSPHDFHHAIDTVLRAAKSFVPAFIWITLVTISFSISNQRLPMSIQEDRVNKPWRPLPSQRITPQKAGHLLSAFNVIGLIFSWTIGANTLYIIQMGLTYMYNDLGGASRHYIVRDCLNGLGMTSWALGAMNAATGPSFVLSHATLLKGATVALSMSTTIAIQDFRDLSGDRECGRNTFPLKIGEMRARFVLAASVIVWSFGTVMVLHRPLVSVLTVLGMIIALRLIFLRKCSADKVTTELWYGWSATLLLTVFR